MFSKGRSESKGECIQGDNKDITPTMFQGDKECGISEYQAGCLIDVNSVLYVLESYSKTEDNWA